MNLTPETSERPSLARAARTGVRGDDVAARARGYLGLFADDQGGGVAARKADYARLVNDYYDLVTDFYENGWGQSFHFAPRTRGESFEASMVRHEHHVALRLGLRPGMKVLDVGCGVGGPMRAIARFCGARVVGINNNDYQVTRGRAHNERAGLGHLCELVKGDFLAMPFEDASFDAAFAIEATCHAPERRAVFAEIARVLRPGAPFVSYEWCMTDRYDPADAAARAIKKGIEEGDALPDLVPTGEVLRALGEAGLEVAETRDMVDDCDAETPWYLPLSAHAPSFTGLRNSPAGRRATQLLVDALELVRVAPRGAGEVHRFLCRAADALVAAGERRIFTPMFFVLARRPAA
ncbi:MAG TPA: methyltransferase domain-containing protein [Myxococcota bacterium]|jgi:sterol 24-C-methyltransferase|nr:methyltransferase domain-containing protein [Myxococcota bacterium]